MTWIIALKLLLIIYTIKNPNEIVWFDYVYTCNNIEIHTIFIHFIK